MPISYPASPILDARPPCDLPLGVSTASVADACRAALLAFLSGTGEGWGKPGLAAWLAGPYRDVVRFAPRVEAGRPRTSDIVPLSVRSQLKAQNLEALMLAARDEVLGVLRLAPQNAGFSHTALQAEWVRRSRDAHGRAGYVPVDHERMRLSDRVLALAAVDYLMRPSDYLALLTVCTVCDDVTFDPHTRARGLCRAHAPSLARVYAAARQRA